MVKLGEVVLPWLLTHKVVGDMSSIHQEYLCAFDIEVLMSLRWVKVWKYRMSQNNFPHKSPLF